MNTAMTIVGIVHILISIAIICLILLQSGKTAGLSGAISGAADSFFGKNKGRTMDAMFSRFTKICAVIFLLTSLFLAYGDTIVSNDAAAAVETDTAIETQLPAETVPVAPATTETAPTADATAPAADATAPAADATAPVAPTTPAPAAPAAPAATAPAAQ